MLKKLTFCDSKEGGMGYKVRKDKVRDRLKNGKNQIYLKLIDRKHHFEPYHHELLIRWSYIS
jgi:hypothetical protein